MTQLHRPDPSAVRLSGPWTHRDVSANGIRLHVAEAGNGPLVLLLHGFPEFWWTWRHQLPALAAAGYRAVAVDLRGHGDSDKPPRGYDGWTLSADIAGLVRALGEHEATLVGHAWGGLLAWTVAAMQPRLVTAVTAVSAPHPLDVRHALRPRRRGNVTSRVGRRLLAAQVPMWPERRLTRDDAAQVERLLRTWSGTKWPLSTEFAELARQDRQAMLVPGVAHCTLECLRWAARSQFRPDGRRFAAEVRRSPRVPVLQVHGAADPLIQSGWVRRSAQRTPAGSRVLEVGESGHFPHQEDPDGVTAALLGFLRGI